MNNEIIIAKYEILDESIKDKDYTIKSIEKLINVIEYNFTSFHIDNDNEEYSISFNVPTEKIAPDINIFKLFNSKIRYNFLCIKICENKIEKSFEIERAQLSPLSYNGIGTEETSHLYFSNGKYISDNETYKKAIEIVDIALLN